MKAHIICYMENADFDELLEARIKKIRHMLAVKGDEYAVDNTDRLQNFKHAGKMLQCIPERALIGMWTKHVISILDIINRIENENKKIGLSFILNPLAIEISRFMLDEKIGDAINYLILLEALLKERYEE